MRLRSLSEASIHPRTSLAKFANIFTSFPQQMWRAAADRELLLRRVPARSEEIAELVVDDFEETRVDHDLSDAKI